MMQGLEITFDRSLYWLALILPLAVLVVGWLYYHKKNKTDWSQPLRLSLALARWTVILLLALLLLVPNVVRFINEEEKPRLLFYRDVSASLSIDDHQKSSQLADLIRQNLADQYELRFLNFGGNATLAADESALTDSLYTDLGVVMNSVNEDFYGENIGAVVVVTDGIQNKGIDPRYVPSNAAAPLFAVGIGDTSVFADAEIAEVLNNQLAFLNNDVEFKVRVRATKLQGKKTEVRLMQNGEVLAQQTVAIDKEVFAKELRFVTQVGQLGLNKFSLVSTIFEGERNVVNNVADSYVDVLDNRTKITLLAKSPHPDVAFFKRAIEKNEQYDVVVELIKDWDGKTAGTDLFIAHGLPTNADELNLLSRITTDGLPLFAVVSPRVSFRHFNALELGLAIDAIQNRTDLVGGSLASDFGLFGVETNIDLKRYPPITAPFGEISFQGEYKVVLNQKVGSIATEKPLVAYVQRDGIKYGFCFAEGFWKWSMFESNLEVKGWTEALVQKSVQYLAIKQKRTRLRILAPHQVEEQEVIELNAEFYNESFELTNDPEVTVVITDPSGNELPHRLKPTNKTYGASIGTLPPGEYTWRATANDGGVLFEEIGSFTVSENRAEFNNLVADHALLNNWAVETGGAFYNPSEMGQLINQLQSLENAKNVIHTSKTWSSLIEWKWLLLLLVAIIGAEWFTRKFTGYV